MRDESKNEQLIEHINKHYSELLNELKMIDDSYEQYRTNKVCSKAIKLDLLQIGELFSKLTDGVKSMVPKADQNGLKATRNFLVHDYEEIREKTIWDTVHQDLPRLVQILNSISN